MKILNTILFSFTIWVVAALINAGLITTLLIFFGNRFESWPGAFVLALFFSLLFSAPGIFIFWIVFLVNIEKERLFAILLKTGFVTASISAILFVKLLGDDFKAHSFYMAIFGVVAAIVSIVIHHTSIKSINKNSA